MVESQTATRRRLVGQPLLYTISVFASLGVFLVSIHVTYNVPVLTTSSSDMIKGNYVHTSLCATD